MKWSFRLLRISGISVRLHATLLIVVGLLALHFQQHYGASGVWFGALFACALFACVTLHELGHSLVAQRFGIDVKEIILLPFGGASMLGREPRKAWHELLIALAGPLVNVMIAALLLLALRFGGLSQLPQAWPPPPSLHGFAWGLLLANVILAAFNMVPALPMDGGRALRAVLTMVLDKPRATRIAAGLGQLLAVGFVVFALTRPEPDPILAVIGVLIFFSAAQERSFQQATTVLAELKAGEVCNPDAVAFSPSDPLGVILDEVLRSPQPAFLVLHGRELVGLVTRHDVLHAAPALGPSALVSKIVRRDFLAVHAELRLDELRSRMIEARGPAVVMGPEGPLGVLTFEDLQRVAAVMQELARRGLTRPVPAAAPET